ncbi:MAG: glycosyltransferase family 39 protein, partial [Acidimicrobiia bacterium]
CMSGSGPVPDFVITSHLPQTFDAIRIREGTPPLYFAFMSAWIRIFGDRDGTLRSFSAVVGTLAIAVVYLAAREFGLSRRIARIAAVLVAVNPFLVWYSQEARAYSLLVLFAALMLFTFARVQRTGTQRDALWFGTACALALATHYFAVFLIVPVVVALLMTNRTEWRRMTLGLLPVVILAIPLGLLAIDQQSRNLQEWISSFAFDFRLRESLRHLLVGPSEPRPWLWVIVAVAVIGGSVLALFASDRRERRIATTLAIIGVVALGFPALTAVVGNDYFLDRNVIAALVPLVVVVAIGLGRPQLRIVGAIAVVAVVAVSLVTTVAVTRQRDLQRADWQAVSKVIRRVHSRQVVVMNTDRVLGSAVTRYLPPSHELARRASVRIQDLVFIGLGRVPGQCSWWFGRTCAMIFLTDEPTAPLAHSFTRGRVDHVGRFIVARYHSPVPVRVGPLTLVRASDRPGSMVLSVARARSHA